MREHREHVKRANREQAAANSQSAAPWLLAIAYCLLLVNFEL